MTILKNVRLNGTVNFTHSPVLNGLQVYYDAGKTASYPGSGTTWFDISGNGRNANLTATSYTTDSGGGLTFTNGSGSRGQSSSFGWSGNAFTMSVWVKPTTVDATIRRFVSMQGESPNFYNWAVTRLDGANGTGQFHSYTSYAGGTLVQLRDNSTVINNAYQNFVVTWNGSILRHYKNNLLINTSGSVSGTIDTSATTNTLIISNATETFAGNMYVVMLYNRTLSNAELTQNYDAFRKRYGL